MTHLLIHKYVRSQYVHTICADIIRRFHMNNTETFLGGGGVNKDCTATTVHKGSTIKICHVKLK